MLASSYYFYVIVIVFKIVNVKSFAQLNVFDENDFQHCVCVPYWQCKDDYSGLVEDGIDIVDIRGLKNAADISCTGDFDVCCKVECGKRSSIAPHISERISDSKEDIFEYRILGNKNAKFAEFPWMLGILKGRTFRCGASLIHPRVAVTAAHCVSAGATYKVRAGEWNWEETTEMLPHQDRLTKKIVVHSEYHPASLRNDIALLILESPFKLTKNVGIACLPHQNKHFNYNNRCIATGWGRNSYEKGTYQSTLKKVDLPIMPRDKCLRILQQARLGPLFTLHKSFICAGGEPNKDTCKGDGGSPLVCPVPGHPERFEQVGIVSWGLSCGMNITPGVYVNVALFSDWIDNQMLVHNFDTSVYRY